MQFIKFAFWKIFLGYLGEATKWDCQCTIVQKTHGFSVSGLPAGVDKKKEVMEFSGRGILLIRNPYHALVAYRNYKYGGHTGYAPVEKFKGQSE